MSTSEKVKKARSKGKSSAEDTDPERLKRMKMLEDSCKASVTEDGTVVEGGGVSDSESDHDFQDGKIEEVGDEDDDADTADYDGPDEVDAEVKSAFSPPSKSKSSYSAKRSYAPHGGAPAAKRPKQHGGAPPKKHHRAEFVEGVADDSEEDEGSDFDDDDVEEEEDDEEEEGDDCEESGYDTDELAIMREMVSKKVGDIRKGKPVPTKKKKSHDFAVPKKPFPSMAEKQARLEKNLSAAPSKFSFFSRVYSRF